MFNKNNKDNWAFNLLLHKYLPYWPLFIILIIICSAAAWEYINSLTPQYEATASIMIKDDASQSNDTKMTQSTNNTSQTQRNVENEIEVLQSRTLMKQVVEKLHLYAPVFETGSLKSAYASSPINIEAKEPNHIKEQPGIPFSFDKTDGYVKINNKKYPLNVWNETPFGVLRFIENDLQKENSPGPLVFQLAHPSDIAKAFLSNLIIEPVNKNSSVIVLRLRETVPERGEDILNELAEAYSRASLNDKNAMVSNTLAFVEDKIKFVENDLDSLEKKIQQYKSRKGIVDLSAQGKMFLENVGSNNNKMADINIQLAVLDQVEKYVVSKDDKSSIVPSTLGVSDPMLTELLQKLYTYQLEYEHLQKTTGENNPVVLETKRKIEKIRPSILENIRNQRAGLTASVNKIDASSGNYSSMLKTVPGEEKELLEFSRQQAIKSSVYTFLLQKKVETALLQSSTVADHRIIDAAEASIIPYSSKKSTIYILAVVLALVLGIIIIRGKELLSTKILFRSELEKMTTAPVVAELAKVKTNSPFIVNQPKHIASAEQFRHLRAAIGLYGRFTNKRRLLVTSGISGEGKSFVSINLALSLALSGKKVALVDLDLRNPKISEIFKLTSERGIVEFLQGSCDPYEIIKKSQFDQLFIVPAGGNTTSPTELLLDTRLDNLFRELDKHFDYLIIDTSPVDPVTDAYVLSEYCDTTLYVIRHRYTPKTMIQLLDESNKIKALKELVIVFNAVKPRGFMQKGYGYGYGYGYENVYKDRVYRRPVKESKPVKS